MNLRIVLLEPMYDGNVGSVARSMKNFGFNDLVLVKPCRIGDFGLAMASHARDLLEGAVRVPTLKEALQGADLVVGTTEKRLENEQRHLRLHLRVPYFTPSELREKLSGMDCLVALVLGREDCGLNSDELEACDILVSIPTSEAYPIMNLSHAATVLLYELRHACDEEIRTKLASGESLRLLQDKARALLSDVSYPEHKLDYTILMLRRVFGRAGMTEREVNTLLGVIKKIQWQLNRKP
jgi:tRNA/rRNA methyltransferase